MEMLNHFRRQFSYNAWANREVLGALRAQPSPRLLELLSHIISAEQLWLERICERPQSLPVWPDFTLERCNTEMRTNISRWGEYLQDLSELRLADSVAYKNSKGEQWKSTVSDILAHVLLHSAYHRGQIAAKMREEGNTPAATDFIHAVRQGFVD